MSEPARLDPNATPDHEALTQWIGKASQYLEWAFVMASQARGQAAWIDEDGELAQALKALEKQVKAAADASQKCAEMDAARNA